MRQKFYAIYVARYSLVIGNAALTAEAGELRGL
jgi:hypothetical protein